MTLEWPDVEARCEWVHRACGQVCKDLDAEGGQGEGSSWSPTDYAARIWMAREGGSTLEHPLQKFGIRLHFVISLLLCLLFPAPSFSKPPTSPIFLSNRRKGQRTTNFLVLKGVDLSCGVRKMWLHRRWGNHQLWTLHNSPGKNRRVGEMTHPQGAVAGGRLGPCQLIARRKARVRPVHSGWLCRLPRHCAHEGAASCFYIWKQF